MRQLFISSAAELVEEFHVDGLRVDLTQAMHRDNSLNANGWSIRNANLFGQKCLREWSRTLRMIRPTVMLIAEDHTGWDAVTKVPTVGGLGFDATWLADLYHHLIGDADAAGGAARLIRDARFGSDGPLAMAAFSGRLWRSQFSTVVYHESHDEAGNARGSRRTAKVAVNDAPLIGTTRDFAEARCRVAAGLAILSAGTPMFLMGEEIVAQRLYKYDTIAQSKEDLPGERAAPAGQQRAADRRQPQQPAVREQLRHPDRPASPSRRRVAGDIQQRWGHLRRWQRREPRHGDARQPRPDRGPDPGQRISRLPETLSPPAITLVASETMAAHPALSESSRGPRLDL